MRMLDKWEERNEKLMRKEMFKKKGKVKDNWGLKEKNKKRKEKKKLENTELSFTGPESEEQLLQNMETVWSRKRERYLWQQ